MRETKDPTSCVYVCVVVFCFTFIFSYTSSFNIPLLECSAGGRFASFLWLCRPFLCFTRNKNNEKQITRGASHGAKFKFSDNNHKSLDKSKMSAEYVAQLTAKVANLGMTEEDNVKVAEAYAYVDEKEAGILDIDDIGRLLEAAGKPLPGLYFFVFGDLLTRGLPH